MHASKKKRYDDEDAEILRKVSTRVLTKEMLKEKLARHVQQVWPPVGFYYNIKMYA